MLERVLIAAALLLVVAGCPSPPEKETQYPPRPAGCDVMVFHEAPSMPTENVGPVGASCDEQFTDDECLRELKDRVCKLGGNIVWGVEPNPTRQAGKKKFFGRAAHTK